MHLPGRAIGAAVAPGERGVTADPEKVSVRPELAPEPGRGVGIRLSAAF